MNTVSPLVLIQQREAVYAISRFAPRPQDAVVQAQLINKFYPGRTGDQLRPEIRQI